MWKEANVRRRDKPGAGKPATQRAPQATAEQMRLAQLVDDQNEDDVQLSKNVSKIVEVTGVSEEKALLALYDSNDDPSRAIELLLEKQSLGEDNEWETAGRRKHRGGNSVTRTTDAIDEDSKDETSTKNKSERNTTGKGRGRKGRQFDQSRPGQEDNNKENENVQTAKDRRPGRGRSRSGPNRGRGRGAPRHSRNRVLGGKSDDNSGKYDTRNTLDEPVDMWESTSVKCWDIEVGTWSSKDVQKRDKSAGDSYQGNWGTDSWADDLSESRVFQAQNTPGAEPSESTQGGPVKPEVGSNHDRISNAVPQTGERIDLGMLFKKSSEVRNQPMQSGSNYGGFVNMGHEKSGHNDIRSQTEVAAHVQGFQQHNQMKAPFGESNVSASTVTSRLFSDYEQTQHNQQSVSGSLFQSDDTSNLLKNSYPQLNGNANLHSQTKDSSFLESFSGIGSNTNQESQSDILGQLNGLANARSQLPPYSQLRMPIGKDSPMQRQTTGNSPQTTDATSANLENLSKTRDEDHLSFGSPLPPQVNQHSRQQRKKMPTLPPKIPASAVEMPGNKAYGAQDYSTLSFQFGADDPTSLSDLANHDYGVTIPHSISSGIIAQQSGLFLNGDGAIKTSSTMHSVSNTDSLFSQNLQNTSSSNTEHQEIEERSSMPVVLDHSMKVPPGLSMPVASTSSTSVSNNSGSGQHGTNFLSRSDDQGPGRPHDSSFHRASSLNSSFSQEVSPYYVTSTSNHPSQSPKIMPGASNPGQQLHESAPAESMPQTKPTQAAGDGAEKFSSSNMEPSSHAASMSSLAASLSQVSIPQNIHTQVGDSTVSHSTMSTLGSSSAVPPSPYSSTMSTADGGNSPSSNLVAVNRKAGYNTVQNSAPSSSYDESATNVMQNRTPAALSPLPHSMQQTQMITSTVESVTNQGSAFKMLASSAASPSGLGGFATAKMPPAASTKGNVNVPSGVTAPMYGIPMAAGLMPYAAPDMPYGYDQLLLQSRVVNPLNFYDMHFHGNNQATDGQDSSASIGQNLPGHGKYNRTDASSSTPPNQMNMPGTVGSELSQHNTSIPMQPIPPKAVTQSSGHHTGQQQYVGAMPYPNYSSLATPYYSLGMANAGFQYPATMFAAAMHQAPKHAVSTADGFQQPSGRYNHTSAITSSSGLSDLSRPNYPKTHPSGLEKQQGYHQHTNTPPPFNLQTITAAVAAGGGAANANTNPGLSPYAAPPYMALLQPHHASQQQTMHLLQHQHQDPTSGHPVGSQRNLGSSSIVKPTKRAGYGNTTSSYWGN